MQRKYLTLIFILISVVISAQPDKEVDYSGADGRRVNYISTAVPFVNISPDSRSAAMGDVGVATSQDVYSQFWNAAKYAFSENINGIAISYTPWLRSLSDEIYLGQLVGFFKLDDQQTISGSLRYFHLGEITITGEAGDFRGVINPNEYSMDIAYTRKFTPSFSMSLAPKYIRSDILSQVKSGPSATDTKPGQSIAVDLGLYYQKDIQLADKDGQMAYGLNISNMGNKISYDIGDNNKLFLPTLLKIGGRITSYVDSYNSVSLSTDLSKLMVPTPNDNKNEEDYSLVKGMFTSFGDAPGGFKEEIHEVMLSVGGEWWYREQFALRGGFFLEHESKGARKYGTLGLGLKLNIVTFDFAYLLADQSPLANTLRFSIAFNFL